LSGVFGIETIDDHDVATQQMIDSLQAMLRTIITMNGVNEELFDLMVENKHCDAIERTAGLLESIGVFAVNLDIRDVLHQSVHLLHKMSVSSAKNNLVLKTPKGTLNIAERVIDHLLKVEGETLKYKSKSKEFDIIINDYMKNTSL